jgi:shikimate kinase
MPGAQILVLTGSPGCGKTTVAPLVADRRARSACLDLDWFFAKLRSGSLAPWTPESHEQNRVVHRATAAALVAFVTGGYDTLGEGIVYPSMLDLFATACAAQSIALHYAVLQAPLAVTLQRVRDRRFEPAHADALDDPVVIEGLWRQFEDTALDQRPRVDSGHNAPAEVASEIETRWRAGDFEC